MIADEAARTLCAALDWADGPLLRARVRATADGSAKPSEVARALGVWGPDDPRAQHALVARLGVVDAAARAVRQSLRPPPAAMCRPARSFTDATVDRCRRRLPVVAARRRCPSRAAHRGPLDRREAPPGVPVGGERARRAEAA